MRPTIGLGRWFGIPVGLNLGVLVIIALVGAGLAFGLLPAQFPDRPAVGYAVAGLAGALLLVLSILVHELAHAMVGRAKGVEIEGITLWLLGGVARMRSEPRTPRDELAVTAVGPVASLALGLVFGVLSAAAAAAPVDELAAAVLGYLAAANIVLAVFNLLPAAPLDGGRVLRAAVWWWTGDRFRAATVAARAGRIFGFGLIGAGIAQLLFLPGLGGIWLALIGLFMVHAASVEEEQARTSSRLYGVRARDVMSDSLVAAPPESRVDEFIDEVALRRPHSTYPLVDDRGRLTGLVTLNRIRAVPAQRREDTRLHEIACSPEDVPTTTPEEPVTELLARMEGCSDGRAVVLDGEQRVIGVVSPTDIARMASAADLRAADPYPPRGADLSTRR